MSTREYLHPRLCSHSEIGTSFSQLKGCWLEHLVARRPTSSRLMRVNTKRSLSPSLQHRHTHTHSHYSHTMDLSGCLSGQRRENQSWRDRIATTCFITVCSGMVGKAQSLSTSCHSTNKKEHGRKKNGEEEEGGGAGDASAKESALWSHTHLGTAPWLQVSFSNKSLNKQGHWRSKKTFHLFFTMLLLMVIWRPTEMQNLCLPVRLPNPFRIHSTKQYSLDQTLTLNGRRWMAGAERQAS